MKECALTEAGPSFTTSPASETLPEQSTSTDPNHRRRPLVSGSGDREVKRRGSCLSALPGLHGLLLYHQCGVRQDVVDRAFAALPHSSTCQRRKARLPCALPISAAPGQRRLQVFGKPQSLGVLHLRTRSAAVRPGSGLRCTTPTNGRDLPGISRRAGACVEVAVETGPKMMRGLAHAMGMPGDFFVPAAGETDNLCTVRVTHPPPARSMARSALPASCHCFFLAATQVQDDVGECRCGPCATNGSTRRPSWNFHRPNVGDMVVRLKPTVNVPHRIVC